MSGGDVWITGTGGLIGRYLAKTGANSVHGRKVIALTREIVDLTDYDAVRARFIQDRPQVIIHCAALSRTPACQKDPALAHKVNVEVTRALVELAADCQFVFFSTDLVFDGKKGNYIETDETNPLSMYAETKAAAEQVVLRHPKHQIIRTSLNAGISLTGERAFNEEMRQAWANGTELTLFIDEFRCPIAAEVTARATWELISKGEPGIYHLAGSERLSRYQIGQLLATRWPALRPKYRPASLKEYQGAARAADTSLNCEKIQKLLSFALPGFRTWLESPAAAEL